MASSSRTIDGCYQRISRFKITDPEKKDNPFPKQEFLMQFLEGYRALYETQFQQVIQNNVGHPKLP